MRLLGQISLYVAFVAVGYGAFASLMGRRWTGRHGIRRSGILSAAGGVAALSVVMMVLAWALLRKDFTFHYVAQYSSRLLPWYYSLSALWVGQAGSLLLWTWMLGLLAVGYRLGQGKKPGPLPECAFGIVMAYCCFLVATMVFAADPMEANIAPGDEGAGLSPLLQHPAMLIHPPVVFLGYALWTLPWALAVAALFAHRLPSSRRSHRHSPPAAPDPSAIDATWVRMARPWALAAWTVLGSGILLGAYWSYEELGWGGYWAWDPVENGSLIPWLIGTSLLHSLMVSQFRGMMKKTSIALSFATFGMCNFATFLTRSGIFSSLHAFSQSPIGWLFLALMVVVGVGGTLLVVRHRHNLTAENRLASVWSRESMVVISTVALLLMAAVTIAGTLSVALSQAVIGRRVMVGPAYYNSVLIPIGLVLLATLSAAPLLRWGASPLAESRRALWMAAAGATLAAMVAGWAGVRHPLGLAVSWLSAFAVATLAGSLVLDVRRRRTHHAWRGAMRALLVSRRMYAGFVIHLGFVCIAVGVTGSSLASHRREVVMKEGEQIEWAGRVILFRRMVERQQPDKFIAEAELEIRAGGQKPYVLRPAQHLHRLQDQWTTEVAIHSTWGSDFYTILHDGEGRDAVRLTLVVNPLMRWMWFGGWVIGLGTLIRLWPSWNRPMRRRPPIRPADRQPAHSRRRRPAAAATQRQGAVARVANMQGRHG